MKIIRADILGFCSGVRRAVSSANEALNTNNEENKGNVYSFGALIHNPTVLKDYEKRGLNVLSENNIHRLKPNDKVLIRAHGVSPEIEQRIREQGCEIINATCPLVTQSQKKAAKFAEQNYNIIFAGDKNHAEVIGIEGCANESYKKNNFTSNFLLVRDVKELENLFVCKKIDFSRKTVLLSQTTFSIPIFDKIKDALKEKIPDADIVSSICPATHERQAALEELCKKVEGILVIGGKTSANTSRLFATAQKFCKNTALIETKDEIPQLFYKLGTVGITAGASTPDDVIESVEKALNS